MSIAIIGGAGFIGTRLVKRLVKSDRDFIIYDKDKSNLKNSVYVDIENIKSLEKIKGNRAIVNLAAEHRDDVSPISRYDDVNVKGAINICQSARKYGIEKIIFTSSVAIYGFAPANTNESGDAEFFNDYGRTKFLAEKVFKDWQKEDPGNRTLVIVRPTVVFGEGNRGNVYNLLRQVASGFFVMFGNGKNKKSMAYVENVAAFLEYSLSFKSGIYIYNYIDKPDLDMNTLVSQVRKLLFGKNNIGFRLPAVFGFFVGYIADFVSKIIGKSLPVSSIRVKKFMSTTQFSSSIDETGFIPPISLEDGLNKTLHYEFLEDNSDKRTFKTE